MARAKLREIILPDALSPSSVRPGPKTRSTESYREFAAALRSKELISSWSLADDHSNSSELQLREALTRTLAEHCYFGYIRTGTKLPHSHPTGTGKARYSISTESGSTDFQRPNGTDWLGSLTAPRAGNWSVIPRAKSRLLIFDLDVKKQKTLADGSVVPTAMEDRYLEARTSVGYLETALGIDLRQTYAQLSPSGGVHIFLLLPEGIDPNGIPASKISNGLRMLAGIPEELWKTELRGDIRSGASNGFILMAGSKIDDPEGHYRPLVADPRWSDFKDYRSGRKLRLLELPLSAVERLREAQALDGQLQSKNKRFTDHPKRTLAPVAMGLKEELKASNANGILRRLQENPPGSFHEARAKLYRALSCCASPSAIASLCRDAGYGRDTYSNRELSDEELLSDMESMASRGLTAERCGSHCSRSGAIATEDSLNSNGFKDLLDSPMADLASLSSLSHSRIKSSDLFRLRSALQIEAQRRSAYGIYGKRKPQGFDYQNILREILGSSSYGKLMRHEQAKIAGYRLRALELAVGYFGPLFSAGSSAAISSTRELTGLFGWTESQLREALRHLRALGIISLAHRQVSGRASSYSPGEDRFFDPILSRKLRGAWGLSRLEDGQGNRAFLGGYFDHSRGKIVRPDGTSYTDSYLQQVGGSFTGLLDEFAIQLPRAAAIARSVVSRYLSKSLDRYLAVASKLNSEKLQSAIDEIKELGDSHFPSRVRERISVPSEILWTSQEASRKDRSAGSLKSIHVPEGSVRLSGDRSPPVP